EWDQQPGRDLWLLRFAFRGYLWTCSPSSSLIGRITNSFWTVDLTSVQSLAGRAGAICTCLSARLDHGEKIFPEQCEELAVSAGGSSEELTEHAGACPRQGRVGKNGPATLSKDWVLLLFGFSSYTT